MFKKLRKNLVISVAAGAVIFLLLSVYADYDQVIDSLLRFKWYFLPGLFLLSFLNYFSRFLKWHYYLRLLKIKTGFIESMVIFMTGLTMSITPGKVGELLKCYLVKNRTNVQMSITAPVVLAERITDFISLVLIALAGAYIYGYGHLIIISTGVFFIVVSFLLSQKKLLLPLIDLAGKISFLKKHIAKLKEAYESTYQLLKIKPLILMSALSLPAWFFECIALYFILKIYGEDSSVMLASFIYAFSTIAGSITMLPAGLGVTEGSLTFLLHNFGVEKGIAVGSTFIIRIVTLWFAIFVGVVFSIVYQKRYGQIKLSEIDDLKAGEI